MESDRKRLRQTFLTEVKDEASKKVVVDTSTCVPPMEVVAVEWESFLQGVANGLQCFRGGHYPTPSLASVEGKLLMQFVCECNEKSGKASASIPSLSAICSFAYKSKSVPGGSTCILFTKESLRNLSKTVKLLCGYVPKVSFSVAGLELSCGHHKSCERLHAKIAGYINL
jgi:hypothetical protein